MEGDVKFDNLVAKVSLMFQKVAVCHFSREMDLLEEVSLEPV